uniref:Putative tail protein n=1 Tax=viral metagenome TaxID=1070528 RepID=A0A6M3J5X8_9ZZZZ
MIIPLLVRRRGTILIDTFTGAGPLSGHSPDTGPSNFYSASGVTWELDGAGNLINTPTLGSTLITDGSFAATTKATAKTVVGITKANPGVVTFAAGHGYLNGHVIYFFGLTEMTELNGGYFKLRNNAGNTFELSSQPIGTWDTASHDTSGYGSAETTGGACVQRVTLTSWTVSNAEWAPGVNGSGSLTGTADCSSVGGTNISQSVLEIGRWYQSIYTLNRTSGSCYAQMGSLVLGTKSVDGTYTEYGIAEGSTNFIIRALPLLGSISTVSVKKLTDSELSERHDMGFSQGYFQQTLASIPVGALVGVDLLWNAAGTDGLRAYINRATGTGVLRAQIAGVWQTALIDTAITYSAGKNLVVLFDGQYVYLFYNNALVGTRQDISALTTITSNTYWGNFSTDSSTTISAVTAKPLSYGADLFDPGVYAIGIGGWVKYGNNTVTNDAGEIKITYVDSAPGAYLDLKDSKDLSADLVVGGIYCLEGTARVNEGSVNTAIYNGSQNVGTTTVTSLTPVRFRIFSIEKSLYGSQIILAGMGGTEIIWLGGNMTLRKVQ